MRFKREVKKLSSSIVIIGIVPETIKRNLSVWKHYNEFGNTLGFKPRFKIEKGKLKLIPNFINTENKFFEIKKYLSRINEEDYFYKEKFKRYIFTFPYTISIIKNPRIKLNLLFLYGSAYLLDSIGIKWKKLKFLPREKIRWAVSFDLKDRISYYCKKDLLELTLKILMEFSNLANKNGLTPVFVMLPEYDDMVYIKRTGDIFYKGLIDSASKFMLTLDLSEKIVKVGNIGSIYSNKEYGGHYNTKGNALVAETIFDLIQKEGLLPKNQ